VSGGDRRPTPQPGADAAARTGPSDLSSDELVGLLPHRPPFRFVDRVVELVAGDHVEASYQVTGDEPFLAGHFPGRPIFPGVLQLEALAQAGAIALLADPRYAGRLPLFGGVEGVRFRRQVLPGDELVLRVELEQLARRGGWGQATATVDGATTCAGRLFFVLAPDVVAPGA
jgi:3-hydroxyacyl-[acyl-carrier-protein] dehydratase